MSRSDRVRVRYAECQKYIALTSSLPAAMALAKSEGYSAPTTAWIGAKADLLVRQELAAELDSKPAKKRKS